MKILLIFFIVSTITFIMAQDDGSYRSSSLKPIVSKTTRDQSINEGRYRGDNDGRYRPSNDGKYIPEKTTPKPTTTQPTTIPPTTTTVRITTTPPTTTTVQQRKQNINDSGSKIIRQEDTGDEDGYHYLFETENGILAEESGRIENKGAENEGLRSTGFYEYIGDDGKLYRVDYVADEKGFVPRGDHIPKTPPAIVNLLANLASQPQQNKK